jgi:hypothetical protein
MNGNGMEDLNSFADELQQAARWAGVAISLLGVLFAILFYSGFWKQLD